MQNYSARPLIGLMMIIATASLEGETTRAEIVNGGFESGDSSGWSTLDTAQVVTAALGIAPTQGKFQALLTTGTGSAMAVGLESFLELTAGTLSGLGNGPVIDGSAIKQTRFLAPGDQISLDADFLTNESPGPRNRLNDFAFASLAPSLALQGPQVETLASVRSPGLSLAPPSSGFAFQTGYSPFVPVTVTTAGTYTIGFGVVDVGPFAGQTSGLLLDNIRVVPEPASLILLGLGLLGLLGFGSCYSQRASA